MEELGLWGEIQAAAATIGRVLVLGFVTGCFAAVLAYGTVQVLFKPILESLQRRALGEAVMRFMAVGVGMAITMIWHGWAPPSSPLSFGNGPPGWWAAAAFGFIGGGFAPALHDKIHRRKKKE